MFVQHIIIWAFIGLGVIFVITKTMARENTPTRNSNKYIDDTFRVQNPTTWDVFDALYSWETAYTKHMNWYDFVLNTCKKENINFIEITWSSDNYIVLPQLITENTIYILNGWKYTAIDKITLSWDCISLIWKGNVQFAGILDTTKTKYSIVDNISYHNNRVILPEYTTITGINIQLENNTSASINYIITWDINQEITGDISTNDIITKTTILNNSNNINSIDTIFYDTYNILNHLLTTSIHDNIFPVLTWTKVDNSTNIINNWLYNTWIRIEISDTNLSGIYNNSLFLSWWINSYDNTFYLEWIYNIVTKDKAGNQTGISFEIDITPPTISNLQPSSGSIFTSTSLKLSRQINENTTRLQSQNYYLYSWNTNTIITSWSVTPGSTWITLVNINSGTYNRKIVVTDKAGNTTTWSIPFFSFNKTNSIFTGTTAYMLGNIWYTNTDPVILFSGNKTFTWYLYTGSTWATNFIESWDYTNIWTITSKTISRYGGNTGSIKVTLGYKTQDNEIGTGVFDFFVDKTVPVLLLNPSWGRRNTTWDINYSRSSTNKTTSMIKHYTFSMNNTIVYSWTNTTYIQTWITVNQEYKAQVCAYDIAWNVWCSSTQTIIIDQTSPQIHNVINSWFYKTIPNPAPIIVDENNEPIYNITVKRNWIIVLNTGHQNSPYVINLQWWEAIYQIIATDEAWNSSQISFTIDTTFPSINLINPTSWTIITWNNTIIFSWTWNDWYFSWYEFILSGNSYGSFYTGIYTTNSNKTITNLNNWTYQRQVNIYDKAWNKTKSPIFPLSIEVPLTGTINLWWVTTISYINYTRTWSIQLQTNINKPTIATITWDIVSQYWYNMINKEISAWNQITSIDLTPWEWQKNIYIMLKDYVDPQEINSFQSVVVDTTWPSKPVLTNINNQIYTWAIILNRPASIDNWADVKEYNYQIEQNNQIKKIGTGTTPSITIENMELWLQWTFTLKVQATDHIWNQSERSESAIFNYAGIPDISPETFTFSRQTNVKRNTIYRSNSITISWLSTYTFVTASIDEWNLFVNGTDVNTQSLITNWDVLYIELESSDEYYDVTTSTLTISDKAAIFKLVTEKDEDEDYDDDDNELSDDEIDELDNTYELIDILDDTLKLKFKDMLEEKIDELEEDWEEWKEIEKLRYIYDRLVEDINNTKDIIYTAPNGKDYIIIEKKWLWYTSINFSINNQSKYFPSLEEIKSFIDKNNGWTSISYTIDKSWSTAAYTAPNGKVYNLFKTTTEKYSSYNMVIPKLFNSLQELKDHINKNNPKR